MDLIFSYLYANKFMFLGCIATVFTCLSLSLALTASFAGCLLTSVPHCLLFCCLKNWRAFLRKNSCSEEVNG